MELEQISTLLERFDASSCSRLELELGDCHLRLEKPCGLPQAAPAPVAAPQSGQAQQPPQAEAKTLNAPLVGTFYAASAPGEAPFVSVGDTVKKGQTLCVLEAMKMMSEVPAPCDCVILEILAKDGDLVGFDAPLFQVREL